MPRERRQRGNDEESAGSDWMTSYGDMMTLMCTFFVLIISFSTIELIKFRKAMGALRGVSGAMVEEQGKAVYKILTTMSERRIVANEDMEQTLEDIEETTSGLGIGQEVTVNLTQKGVRFRISSPVMFESGQAILKPEAFKLLAPIAKLVRKAGYNVSIEGHTDNIPMNSTHFPSNWELSAIRAVSVLRYFVERHGVNPTKATAIGYGEFRPIASNDIPKDRALNRRVEICLEWPELNGKELLESRKSN